ncbi:related to isoamyl alcohol oxidase [Rhynchosporium graminicola]|uniref:Related to isoamyl alcohol oxidase n=1 Tax=Rhynchosporium graminicola TaxID=2792576 RepID=A0A1E1L8I9_9HELO|nr:related to isoamyl alcohol oxidase [Rhynchosporium commune]
MLAFSLLQIVLSLVSIAESSCASPSGCKCSPQDSCWPSAESWTALNISTSGKLIKTAPPAAVCYPGPQEDRAACATVLSDLTNSTYVANNPIALDYPINETCPAVNYTAGATPRECTLGGLPVYAVNASTPEDVVQAVNFARKYNIRFVVRNTGHDILGRSTGYGSLEVWIRHLRQGIEFQETYTPRDQCNESGWTGSAVSIGGGYVWGDVYAEANKRNVVVTVGCIGGWAQGGGHSPASRDYGLGADQILSARVVLASGKIVTANACQNKDLFFAIRGGGGGTYGVVVSTVVKVHPSTSVVAQTFAMAPYNDTYIPQFMEALAILYDSYADLNDGGYSGYGSWAVQSYAPVLSNTTFLTGYQHVLAVFNQSLSSAQTTFAPIAARLVPYNSSSLFISTTYYTFPSYQSYYNTLSGFQSAVGTSGAVGSRLLDRRALALSPALKTMLNTTAGLPGQFTQTNLCLVSGGQVFADAAQDPLSGVNPAWRTAYVHSIVARGWAPGSSEEEIQAVHEDITTTKIGALRKLAPGTGSYMNEADRMDPLFLRDFYGASLERLREVKRRVDGGDLFYCPTCVGSEEWFEEGGGRLCRQKG